LFPLWEFVVLVVLTWLVVLRTVFVVPANLIVELAMNVEMVFQSVRYSCVG